MPTNMTAFCFTQNQRDEVRFLQGTGGVVGAIPATNYGNGKQENMVLINRNLDLAEPLFSVTNDSDPQVCEEHTATIQASDQKINVVDPNDWVVRGLTPRVAERLQGFPDDWTKVGYRGKDAEKCPDTPRYKACGNSMAVPVIRYLGERISMVEDEIVNLML